MQAFVVPCAVKTLASIVQIVSMQLNSIRRGWAHLDFQPNGAFLQAELVIYKHT